MGLGSVGWGIALHLGDAHEEDIANPLSGIQRPNLAQTDASQEGDEGASHPYHGERDGRNRRPCTSQHLGSHSLISHNSRKATLVMDYYVSGSRASLKTFNYYYYYYYYYCY
jgi:hypothetical protein